MSISSKQHVHCLIPRITMCQTWGLCWSGTPWGWQASDGFHATTPAATREEAIEAGRAAVALWAGEVGP